MVHNDDGGGGGHGNGLNYRWGVEIPGDVQIPSD